MPNMIKDLKQYVDWVFCLTSSLSDQPQKKEKEEGNFHAFSTGSIMTEGKMRRFYGSMSIISLSQVWRKSSFER